jgi:hypothetical protein
MPHNPLSTAIAVFSPLVLLAADPLPSDSGMLSSAKDLTALAFLGVVCVWLVIRTIPSVVKTVVDGQKDWMQTHEKTLDKICDRHREDSQAVVAALALQTQAMNELERRIISRNSRDTVA